MARGRPAKYIHLLDRYVTPTAELQSELAQWHQAIVARLTDWDPLTDQHELLYRQVQSLETASRAVRLLELAREYDLGAAELGRLYGHSDNWAKSLLERGLGYMENWRDIEGEPVNLPTLPEAPDGGDHSG